MGKPTKIPYDPRKWQRASSTDPLTWAPLATALATAGAAADRFDGIGFCFSADDPFAGVDLDNCIDEAGVMEPWAVELMHLLDSYTEISPSGRGVKIFLRGKLPPNSRNRTGRVEMYDKERYFTFTGRAYNGTRTTIEERGPQLLEAYKIVFGSDQPAPPAPVSAAPRQPIRLDDADLIERAKAAENGHTFDLLWRGDISNHGNDHSAADMALCDHLAFWTGPDTDRIDRLFRQSGLCREKWTGRADYRKRTIDKALADRTEFYEAPTAYEPADASVVESIGRLIGGKPTPAVETVDPQFFELEKYLPKNLRESHGIVASICNWINDTAYKQQPVLALANALAFWGAVVGRKVRTPSDLRTNLYCLGVGESGCGKDHSRKCIKRICDAAGLTGELLGGEEVSSDSAILNAVYIRPSILFQFDEIGHFFANANSRYAATHQRNIAPTFTKLFSSANTTLIGREYAGRDTPRRDIVQPNACLYGTTVPGRLYEGLTLSEITDGFLGRMLVFQSDNADPPERDIEPTAPPDEIVLAVQKWYGRKDLPQAAGNVAAITQHVPITVPFNDGATAALSRFRELCRQRKKEHRNDNGLDVLWTRALEHARKVALVVACGGEFDNPVVTEEVADWSVRLVEHLVTALVLAVRNSISSSDYERDLLYVQRVIRESGAVGIGKTPLVMRTRRLTPKQRQEIISQLVTTCTVVCTEKKNARGPASMVYVDKNYCI